MRFSRGTLGYEFYLLPTIRFVDSLDRKFIEIVWFNLYFGIIYYCDEERD